MNAPVLASLGFTLCGPPTSAVLLKITPDLARVPFVNLRPDFGTPQ